MAVAIINDITAAPKESGNHPNERYTRNHHAVKMDAEPSLNEICFRESAHATVMIINGRAISVQ